MTFLTILGVTEILCSFRLVLEGKTGKEIPASSRLDFLGKVFRKQFYFIRWRRKHLQVVEWRRYSRFTFVENTITNSPEVSRVIFLGNDGFFCFISTCKFDSLKNPFVTITSLSELYFRFRRFVLLVQTKVVSMNYDSSTGRWKSWRWVRWGLTWYFRWVIYTSIPTWTHSQNSCAAEALSLKISSHGTSLKWS